MKDISRASVGITGCALIGLVCWWTQSGTPLWALFIIALILVILE